MGHHSTESAVSTVSYSMQKKLQKLLSSSKNSARMRTVDFNQLVVM